MPNELLRQSIRLAIAIFLTAAIALHFNTIAYAWYPLLAVVVVIDDNNDQSLKSATSRILGTITGGLITFLVHTILAGWIGVLVSMLLMVLALRMLGWQNSMSTAALVSLMFLMISRHEELNWSYVFQRSLDTSLGCAIGIGIGLVLWPRNGLGELRRLEAHLRATLLTQSHAILRWLQGQGSRPEPLLREPLTQALLTMENLVARELRGPHSQQLHQQRWSQRLRLWDRVQHHWSAWETLLLSLPDPQGKPELGESPTGDPLKDAVASVNHLLAGVPEERSSESSSSWEDLAKRGQVPLLVLLALAEEGRPLRASLTSLHLVCRWH